MWSIAEVQIDHQSYMHASRGLLHQPEAVCLGKLMQDVVIT